MIYPIVLNLVQRFDQQRRGFLHALSYISISILIYLYIRVSIYVCVFFPRRFLFLSLAWAIDGLDFDR